MQRGVLWGGVVRSFVIMTVFLWGDFIETLVCFGRGIAAMGYYKTAVVYTQQPFRKWKCRGVSDAAMVGRSFLFSGDGVVCRVLERLNVLFLCNLI